MHSSPNNNQTAYLFDVDGVLTDLVEKQVTETALFSYLSSFLHKGDIVAFNTGRSAKWVKERIINQLFEKLDKKELLSDVIIVAEKGGVWMTFDDNATAHQEQDPSMAIPQEFNEQIKQLVEGKYNDAMFFDDTKETMISVEMHDGFDLSSYNKRQKEFNSEVEQLLSKKGLNERYKIHSLSISTDVEEHHAGKALGVDRLLTLFDEKGIIPGAFITFGDSPADFEMGDELAKRGKDITFVYTGDKETLGEITKPYPIEFAEGYSRGTLSYLENLVKDSV